MHVLLVATSNEHKVNEYRQLLADIPYMLQSLKERQVDMEVGETGITFAENAELKARVYARASGLLALADDSGLEIDALNGEPGIYSARFAGKETPYSERFGLIFERLKGVAPEGRTARFRCAIAIAEPAGFVQTVEGVVEGRITDEPRGTAGFGYDPIFFVPELNKTFAEVTPEVKNRLSHRGRAAALAAALLKHWRR